MARCLPDHRACVWQRTCLLHQAFSLGILAGQFAGGKLAIIQMTDDHEGVFAFGLRNYAGNIVLMPRRSHGCQDRALFALTLLQVTQIAMTSRKLVHRNLSGRCKSQVCLGGAQQEIAIHRRAHVLGHRPKTDPVADRFAVRYRTRRKEMDVLVAVSVKQTGHLAAGNAGRQVINCARNRNRAREMYSAEPPDRRDGSPPRCHHGRYRQ